MRSFGTQRKRIVEPEPNYHDILILDIALFKYTLFSKPTKKYAEETQTI